MKKILFTLVIISSLSQAMNPEKWIVERRDGGKLTSEQIQKITLIDNARGCPETNWVTKMDSDKHTLCLEKIKQNKAQLVILTHPQQLKRLKRIPDLHASLFAKQNNKTNLFLNFLKNK